MRAMMAPSRCGSGLRAPHSSSAPLSSGSSSAVLLSSSSLPRRRRRLHKAALFVAQAFQGQAPALAAGIAPIAPVAAAPPSCTEQQQLLQAQQQPQPQRGAVIAAAAAAAAATAIVFEQEQAAPTAATAGMMALVEENGAAAEGALAAAVAALALVPPSLIAVPAAAAAAVDCSSAAAAAPPLPARRYRRRAGALAARVGRALAAPYHAYGRALDAHPLLTKALTSATGFVLGDLLAQLVAAHGDGGAAAVDAARLARLGLYGLTLDGPLGSLWYDWLEAHVMPGRGASARAVVAKTALDQLVYASAGTALFLAANTLLEGRPAGDVGGVLAAKLVPTLAANWLIWPAAHLVNFRYVPARMRVAYNQTVAIGWLALLSAITHAQGGGGGGEGGGALLGALLGLLPGGGGAGGSG